MHACSIDFWLVAAYLSGVYVFVCGIWVSTSCQVSFLPFFTESSYCSTVSEIRMFIDHLFGVLYSGMCWMLQKTTHIEKQDTQALGPEYITRTQKTLKLRLAATQIKLQLCLKLSVFWVCVIYSKWEICHSFQDPTFEYLFSQYEWILFSVYSLVSH